MKTVVAALIESDSFILACRRRSDQEHGGKWEFPGGKVEPREKLSAALARELREELQIDAEIGAEITRYEYAYPGKDPMLLVFFRVTSWTGDLSKAQFAETRWIHKTQLGALDFLDGDVELIRSLSASGG